MTEHPKDVKVKITFYKESGKWYESGTAIVNHFLFEPEFKQDLVNTQDVLSNWDNDFYVVVEDFDDNENGFHQVLYKPGEFTGIHKQTV